MNGRRLETTTSRPPLLIVEEVSADMNPFPGDMMRRPLIHFLVVERAYEMQPNSCWDTESIAVSTPKILTQIRSGRPAGTWKATFSWVLGDS